MNRSGVAVAVLVVSALTAWSQAGPKLEALPSEAKARGAASRVYVAWVGDPAEPFSGSLVSGYHSELETRGYQSAKAQGIIKDMEPNWPKFKSIDDARAWLKDGHKVHARPITRPGQTVGLLGAALSTAKHDVLLDGVIALEAAKVSGGASGLAKMGKSFGIPGAGKSGGDEVYQCRATLLNEKGDVVWSAAETVDKASVEKIEEARQDKLQAEQQAKMDAAMKEMKPKLDAQIKANTPAQPAGSPMAQLPPEVAAKLTPEQRAQMEAAMRANPRGGMMPMGAPAAQASPMTGGLGGLAGKMAKMTHKVDVGGPEKWGDITAHGHWDQLNSQLPSIKK